MTEEAMTGSDERAAVAAQEMSLPELARCCRCSVDWVVELVGEGVIEPAQGSAPAHWRFDEVAVVRAAAASRLANDLAINAAGAALALDLLDEIRALRRQVRLRLPE
jgi:chaperone modulatory protein CbpM